VYVAGRSKILEDALALPPTERAALVEEILSSFDFPSRHEVDALWASEVEDRIDAYDRGYSKFAALSRGK
jgi:putative addiction module component (TIGR02574 family)